MIVILENTFYFRLHSDPLPEFGGSINSTPANNILTEQTSASNNSSASSYQLFGNLQQTLKNSASSSLDAGRKNLIHNDDNCPFIRVAENERKDKKAFELRVRCA